VLATWTLIWQVLLSLMEVKYSFWLETSIVIQTDFLEQVKMTNFKEGVTPPPMCAYSLKLPSSASSVVFAPFNETSNDLCVVTCENEIAIFTQNCKTEVN